MSNDIFRIINFIINDYNDNKDRTRKSSPGSPPPYGGISTRKIRPSRSNPNFRLCFQKPVFPFQFIQGPESVKKFASGVVDGLPGHQIHTSRYNIQREIRYLFDGHSTGISKKRGVRYTP